MERLKIAVVGSGIAGLSAAWLLGSRHDVTLFEADQRLGGHANTVDAIDPVGVVAIDTGFIVYNTACYPNLIALFDHLGVQTAPSRMSFAVSLNGGSYEYSGSGARGLFGQPSNIWNANHWRMVRDILKFFRDADAFRQIANEPDLSLGDWLDQKGYSRAFVDLHILPMAAAIWSAPKHEMLAYPAATFARFFSHHGLLQVRNRPLWRTVAGGSRAYVSRLRDGFRGQIHTGDAVARVVRTPPGCRIATEGGRDMQFDRCLIACHADDAVRILVDADADERRILSAFRYQKNEAFLHTDSSQMPVRRRLWASWNYIGRPNDEQLSLSYWMNSLQPLDATRDYFVTLNPAIAIPDHHVIKRERYSHPVFDRAAIEAQRTIWKIQGARATWFAGAHLGYGFHEDGLQSGLAAAEAIGGVTRPWRVPDQSSRLHMGPTGWRNSNVTAALKASA